MLWPRSKISKLLGVRSWLALRVERLADHAELPGLRHTRKWPTAGDVACPVHRHNPRPACRCAIEGFDAPFGHFQYHISLPSLLTSAMIGDA